MAGNWEKQPPLIARNVPAKYREVYLYAIRLVNKSHEVNYGILREDFADLEVLVVEFEDLVFDGAFDWICLSSLRKIADMCDQIDLALLKIHSDARRKAVFG